MGTIAKKLTAYPFPLLGEKRMWAAVEARDKTCDGQFFYSVASTGVYCRPSCPSRQANRQNVAFHVSSDAAQNAGFRACMRCKPDQLNYESADVVKVAEACRLLELTGAVPRLADLAETAGLSPFHFHRLFKSIAGVTPKAYADAHRHQRVRDSLAKAGTVTAAAYDAGFQSTGRFYAKSAKVLGMTPTQFRDGGVRSAIKFAVGECQLGAILVAATSVGVCAIFLGDDPEMLVQDLQKRFSKATIIGGDRAFEKLAARVIAHVDHPKKGLDLPLDVRGTAFQHRVWQALREIPAGCTVSYSQLAERAGNAKSVRAVAGACAANPLAVIVPCHRVVRTDGALSGYRWGIERKRKLLAREVLTKSDKRE